MKAIGEKQEVESRNAWGGYSKYTFQHFEVEADDVGKEHHHYLGFNHGTYTFKCADVGRRIGVSTSTGWTCWNFAS